MVFAITPKLGDPTITEPLFKRLFDICASYFNPKLGLLQVFEVNYKIQLYWMNSGPIFCLQNLIPASKIKWNIFFRNSTLPIWAFSSIHFAPTIRSKCPTINYLQNWSEKSNLFWAMTSSITWPTRLEVNRVRPCSVRDWKPYLEGMSTGEDLKIISEIKKENLFVL